MIIIIIISSLCFYFVCLCVEKGVNVGVTICIDPAPQAATNRITTDKNVCIFACIFRTGTVKCFSAVHRSIASGKRADQLITTPSLSLSLSLSLHVCA